MTLNGAARIESDAEDAGHDLPPFPLSHSLRGKRVLLIAPQPFYSDRGTPINIRCMVNALCEQGAEVDALTLPYGEDFALNGLAIIRCLRLPWIKGVGIGPSWSKLQYDLLLTAHAAWKVLSKRYDVIHGIEEGGFIAWALSRLTGKPFIFDLDSFIPDELEARQFIKSSRLLSLVSNLQSRCLRDASAVISVCPALTDRARELAPQAPIYTIEDCPLDEPTFITEESTAELARELGLNGRRAIVYTGNFEPYQGIGLLLESFALLKRMMRDQPVALLLVGGGERIPEFKQRVEALGLTSDVIFAGQVSSKSVARYLSLADVLVSPRLQGQNTPLKVYSYMAAGRPLVATKILSHTQVLNEETALLAEPNPKAFAEQLVFALDNSPHAVEERRRRIALAQEVVANCFSRDRFSKQIQRAYSEVLSRTTFENGESVIVRSLSGTIAFWNEGAEGQYGWRRDEVVGQITHNLLKTEFPEPLETINQQLMLQRRWSGRLLHKTRTGEFVPVMSHWELRCDNNGDPRVVLEINLSEKQSKPRADSKLAALGLWAHQFVELAGELPIAWCAI